MEIQGLIFAITEQDLNDLLAKHLPPDQPVEELKLSVSAEGLTVMGIYPMFINVRFETRWHLSVENKMVKAELAHFKAMGVPGNIFKSAIVKIIEDLAKEESWITRADDALLIDAETAVARFVWPIRLNLKHIDCQDGQITIFSETPKAEPPVEPDAEQPKAEQ